MKALVTPREYDSPDDDADDDAINDSESGGEDMDDDQDDGVGDENLVAKVNNCLFIQL